jgi:hypothetical protein
MILVRVGHQLGCLDALLTQWKRMVLDIGKAHCVIFFFLESMIDMKLYRGQGDHGMQK